MYVDYIGLSSADELAVQEYQKSLNLTHDIDVEESSTLERIFEHAIYKNNKLSVCIDGSNDSIFDEPDSFKEKFCRKNTKTNELEATPKLVDIIALYGWEVKKLTDSTLTLRPIKNEDVLISPKHTEERLKVLTLKFRAWFNRQMRCYNQGLDSVITEDVTLSIFQNFEYETDGTKIVIKLEDIPNEFLRLNGCALKTVIGKYIF